jgi:DNA-binding protein HU-beta
MGSGKTSFRDRQRFITPFADVSNFFTKKIGLDAFFSCNPFNIQLLLASFYICETGGVSMNKTDLIGEVAKLVGTKKEAQAAVDCIFDSITTALKKEETVSVFGFGNFKVTKRKARKARNPQTGEEITVKAKNVPKFVPGKALKEAVN